MEIKQIETKEEILRSLGLFLQVMTRKPYSEKWDRDSAKRELLEIFENGKDFCFQAEDGGKVVGFIFSRLESWEEGAHLIVEYIVVDPEKRKKGIGAKLFRRVERSAKARAISNLHLISHRQAMAKEFWEKQGFKLKGVIEMTKVI